MEDSTAALEDELRYLDTVLAVRAPGEPQALAVAHT